MLFAFRSLLERDCKRATRPRLLFVVAMIAPISGGPDLWAYALVGSSVGAILLATLTSSHHEPFAYRVLVPYLGFLVAIAWVRERTFVG